MNPFSTLPLLALLALGAALAASRVECPQNKPAEEDRSAVGPDPAPEAVRVVWVEKMPDAQTLERLGKPGPGGQARLLADEAAKRIVVAGPGDAVERVIDELRPMSLAAPEPSPRKTERHAELVLLCDLKPDRAAEIVRSVYPRVTVDARTESASVLLEGESGDVGLAADLVRQLEGRQPSSPLPFSGDPAAAKSFVFVVDRSGSLFNQSDFVKTEMARSVNKLVSRQKFNVIFFSEGDPFFAASNLVAATEENKSLLFKLLQQMKYDGATQPHRAIAMAIGMKPDLIYVLSDGLFVDDAVDEVTRLNSNRVRIDTICFGVAGSEGAIRMKSLAARNRGRAKLVETF